MDVSFAHYVERNADQMPGQTAIICEDRHKTWQDLSDRCKAIAGGLCHLGCEPGARVGYLGLNSDWYYECYLAPSFMGGETVPLNSRLSPMEIADCIHDSEAKILIVDAEFAEKARQVRELVEEPLQLVVIGSDLEEGELSYEELISANHPNVYEPSGGDDTLIIYYSGGTTGKPKGVMLTHWNHFANSSGHAQAYDVRSDEIHMLIGPMFHLAAGARVFCSVYKGCTLVILPKFTPLGFLQTIERHQVNATMFIPAMMPMVLDHPEFGNYDLSSLRQMSFGASATLDELLQRIIAAFPHVDLGHGYGMTEASPLITSLGPEYHRADFREKGKLGAVGKPPAHCEIRVVDEEGNKLAANEVGEVIVRGPNVMKGYVNLPELTAETLRGGWLHTGDAGYIDEDGILWISGRIKDMIISGGENIYPAEIENVLSHHDQVAEVAVIGIPHEKWGEAVHAIVVPIAGSSPVEAELITYCRDRIATYKCPQSVSFRDEPLPLSGANKVLKTELRKPYWD